MSVGADAFWAIEPVKTPVPGQLHLWPDLVESLPDLETVEPFGKRLAWELGEAFAGWPFIPAVPWCLNGASWPLDFYRQLRDLPPSHMTRWSGFRPGPGIGTDRAGPHQQNNRQQLETRGG